MLAGTSVVPPQLDEFVMDGDADVASSTARIASFSGQKWAA